MTCIPVRDPVAPRASRWASAAGAHFLTVSVHARKPGLATPQFHAEFHAATHLLTLDRQWHVRTAVVLPQQVHLLVILGPSCDLPAVVRAFKERLAPCLERAGLAWESGYCDRRLPPGEDALPVFLYFFRTPYRERLIDPEEAWPGYYCAEEEWAWFSPLLSQPCDYPAWLLQWRLYAITPPPA